VGKHLSYGLIFKVYVIRSAMVLKIVISKHQSNQHSDLRILLQKCWEETYFSELSENTTKTMIESLSSDDVGGLFPNNDEQIFVALYDGQPVGCAVSAARGAITYLWGFYILAGYQRLGIGTLLLHRAIAAHGHSNLVQLTVLKTSVNAVPF